LQVPEAQFGTQKGAARYVSFWSRKTRHLLGPMFYAHFVSARVADYVLPQGVRERSWQGSFWATS